MRVYSKERLIYPFSVASSQFPPTVRCGAWTRSRTQEKKKQKEHAWAEDGRKPIFGSDRYDEKTKIKKQKSYRRAACAPAQEKRLEIGAGARSIKIVHTSL